MNAENADQKLGSDPRSSAFICGLFRYQDNLADILSLFHIAVRLAHIVKGKSLIDVRADPFFFDTA